MKIILRIILFGLLVFSVYAAGASAVDTYFTEDTIFYGDSTFKEKTGDTLDEQLFFSNPSEHDEIVKEYLSTNRGMKPGVYTYGERLKVTSFEDGTLSIVTVRISENTDTNQMSFFPKLLAFFGFHKTTDIYTVTRTDYTSAGDVLIKVSLSGWFETGPFLPIKAHFVTFKPEYIAEEFNLLTINGGASPTTKISGSLIIEEGEIVSSYNLIGVWNGGFHYSDSVSHPELSPTEGETGVYRVSFEDTDADTTAEMSVWFSFDGKTSPKAHVTNIHGISHKGKHDCIASYTIDEDGENGQTIVTGTVTARNTKDSEDVIIYTLKVYCTKYGDIDESTTKEVL